MLKKGHIPWHKGTKGLIKHSEEQSRKQSLRMKGHIVSEETRLKISQSEKGKVVSQETRDKMSLANKGKLRLNFRGEKSSGWKGGITPKNHAIRMSLEYKAWRVAVFIRDNHTCVLCKQQGGYLNADHIKSFANYPELRLNIDNGRTLCEPCHRKTDNFGSKNNKLGKKL